MSVIDLNKSKALRNETTREITMPDGSRWEVTMPEALWEDLEFLKKHDGVDEGQLGIFALEEMEAQPVTFDAAFRGVVAHLANRWQ